MRSVSGICTSDLQVAKGNVRSARADVLSGTVAYQYTVVKLYAPFKIENRAAAFRFFTLSVHSREAASCEGETSCAVLFPYFALWLARTHIIATIARRTGLPSLVRIPLAHSLAARYRPLLVRVIAPRRVASE